MDANSKLANAKITTIPYDARKLRPEVATRRVNPSDVMQRVLAEELFLGMVCLERKRAERSSKNVVLILIESQGAHKPSRGTDILEGMIKAAMTARRETDPVGWYKQNASLGIIFTELGSMTAAEAATRLSEKVWEALSANVNADDLRHVCVSVHVFGEEEGPANPTFYPDLFHEEDPKRTSRVMKRAMDIAGSLFAVLVLSPIFLAIAILVKLTSKGPVLFKQERLGEFGRTFTCLKFRSMRANNDPKIHQEFMKKVISSAHDGKTEDGGTRVYKMTNDPRITSIGTSRRRPIRPVVKPLRVGAVATRFVLNGQKRCVRPPMPHPTRGRCESHQYCQVEAVKSPK